ncbi:fibrinogen-like YCDxxxxGGGW domain-containing protein [Nocardioides gilvus]|uniref:fibrinogen-like YCDxxxxGGGW domain-containing protein n=1 Tax=Nocardioides gilvus TaxID=1735589 RepID=UPI000D74F8AD|nr:fibrinogen-like YCDxxxxGGGW domain-containing protein [Nocardioides gilvus]
MFSARRLLATGAALLLPLALTPLLTSGPATAAPIDSAVLGTGPATAAGSCWEIKQRRSSAPSGSYWLLTPAMSAPAQFYCDQTTDGGGWVLVGKGREGWVTDYAGKGSAAALTSPDTVPMSAVTHQHASTTIDALLNDGRVDALSEGVRIRRAKNRTGSSWQEVRLRFSNKSRWTWTFGAEHPVSSWKMDTLSGWGGTSETFGTGQSTNRMTNSTDSKRKYKVGFGYGTSVAGYTDAASHLWAPTNGAGGALPYAQVYLRPRITSTDSGFTAIGNNGTPARPTPATLNDNALVTPWGVNGLAGSTSVEGSVEVQAFAESRGKMYVGGNFRYVQKDAAGLGRVEQSFLAAFDVATGEWDPTFRPELNEQVASLAALPDGTIVAGGTFSRANGRPATAVVGLDPTTGATRASWNLNVENRVSGGVLRVRTLDVQDGFLYLGGSFTHLSGGSAPGRVVYSKNAARVALDATPSPDWTTEFNGTVVSMDAADTGGRVYAAGYFSTNKGQATLRAAALQTAAGAPLVAAPWRPTWSNRDASYQQTVRAVGDRVFVGGAEHALFSFATSNFDRLSGNINKTGGDFQGMDTDGDLVYASCHCAQWTYSGAYTWSSIGSNWAQADAIKWMGIWNAKTSEYVADFNPNFSMRLGSGPWAIKVDSLGRVWTGGDIQTVRTTQGQKFSGGFARFQRSDSTAPAAPTNFRVESESASTVTLRWNSVADASGVSYEILLGDRPIATAPGGASPSATVPRVTAGRYFVRAIDNKGNVGPSTSVLILGGPPVNQAPTASFTTDVSGRTVTLDGSTSTDDGGVRSHVWDLGDGNTATGAKVTHTYASTGTYTVKLTVKDSDGLSSTASEIVNPSSTVSATLVPAGSAWKWYYQTAAPASSWKGTAFDDSSWKTGTAHLGWGAGVVRTNIDTFANQADRPVTAYFRRSFEVSDPSKVVSLKLDTIGDDGVVVHVNGTEVGRENMRDGAVTHTSYAPTARRHEVAAANPLIVDVPVSLLRAGTNVIAAETHVNFRKTADLTFDLKATAIVD